MREEWTKAGIDFDDLSARLGGSETMATKFLKRFLTDETFAHIEEDWNQRNYDTLFHSVHTLKGVAANLSMKQLYAITRTWVDDLRVQKYDTSAKYYQACQKEYQHIQASLQKIFQETGGQNE